MAYRVELPLSRVVARGESQTLTLPVRDSSDAEQTASSGTITIYVGTQTLLSETAITSVGPPASYDLLASTTADEPLSEDWVEVWDLSGLDAFTVRGYLVRRPYHSRVTDRSLRDKHPEILDLLPPGETTGERFRRGASEAIQRHLLRQGRRPWLIFDSDTLYEPEVYLALSAWARDCHLRQVGGPDWLELARDYEQKAEVILGEISFGYDADEDGTLTDDEDGTSAVSAGVTLTAGRPGGWRLGARGLGGGWR